MTRVLKNVLKILEIEVYTWKLNVLLSSLPYWSTTLLKTTAGSIGDKHEELTRS